MLLFTSLLRSKSLSFNQIIAARFWNSEGRFYGYELDMGSGRFTRYSVETLETEERLLHRPWAYQRALPRGPQKPREWELDFKSMLP